MVRFFSLVGVMVMAAVVAIAPTTGINADNHENKDRGGPKFRAELSREQEVPPATSGNITRSDIKVMFDKGLTKVDIDLNIQGGENVIKVRLYCKAAGENGPIALPLFARYGPSPLDFDGKRIRGTLTNADFIVNQCQMPVRGIGRPVNNIADLASAMQEGLIYVNVHTYDVMGGEVRGQLLDMTSNRSPENAPQR